jgi:hypothetical protein
MKRNYVFRLTFLILMLALGVHAQQTYTFTNAGAVGTGGPSQTQINTAYGSTNLSGSVTVTNGIQSFTIPANGAYRITAYGAQGGGSTGGSNTGTIGGFGAAVRGDFTLTAGQVIRILVGQEGGAQPYAGGGGGGSFVVDALNNPLIIAGGGGGATGYIGNSRGIFVGGCGLITTNGGNSNVTTGNYGFSAPGSGGGAPAMGGTQGYGGGGAVAAGGGGFFNIGGASTAPYANPGQGFMQGGAGGAVGTSAGNTTNHGGFGGGGSGQYSTGYGGGGGGYSGGGAGNFDGSLQGAGGGGGSLNTGANQSNTACINAGHGRVTIQELCNITLNASTGTINAICSGQSVTLTTNGVSNYNWSTGATTSSIVVSPLSTTVYTLSATSPSACTASNAITITVNSGPPVLSVNTSTSSLCFGRTATITASGAVTYSWNNGISNGVSFIPSQGTNTYVVTGQNGCGTATAATNITVTPLPVTMVANPSTICVNQSAFVSASAGGGTGYTWTPGSATGSNIIVSPTVNTVYTATVSDGICAGTGSVMITVNPNPTLNLSATAGTICEGESITITVGGADSYSWTPSNFSGTTVADTPTTSTLYQVIGSNSFACTSSTFHLVLVKAAPVITGNLTSTLVCKGSTVTLSASGANTYTWSHSLTGNPVTVTPQSTTVYTVIGVGTNSCTALRVYSVNVAQPVLAVNGPTSTCLGGIISLTAGAGTGYQWSNGGGGFSTASFTPALTTVFSVTATVTGGPNLTCKTVGTIQTIVNPNPTVTVSGPASTVICRADPMVLTASGASSYSWTTNNVTKTGASFTFTSNATVVHTIIATGTETTGCKHAVAYLVRVNACTALDEQETGTGISVYPNPNAGRFTVTSEHAVTLSVINAIGQEVKRISLNAGNSFTADLDNMAAGVYFLVGDEGKRTARIVVSK